MKTILAYILLCSAALSADPVADVRNWHRDGLILASEWNTGGFKPDWHVEQVRKGNRLLPTLKFPILAGDAATTSVPPKLSAENAAFVRDNMLPLSIRTDNIGSILIKLPRLPLVPESIPLSPVVWSIRGGELHDEGVADIFGPIEPWREAGAAWGGMRYMREIQAMYPNAPYVILADNNEVNDSMARYWDVRYVTIDGQQTVATDDFGNRLYDWKAPGELEKLSLRVRDYAAEHTVDEFRRAWHANKSRLYNGLLDSFDGALTAWQGRLLVEGYAVSTINNSGGTIHDSNQYEAQFNHYDGGGSPLYITGLPMSDFTSPEWFKVYHLTPGAERSERLNPNHFREVFLFIDSSVTYDGLKAGRHAFLSPAAYSGHLQWLLWSIKGVRRPVHLRHWIHNASAPDWMFYKTPETAQIAIDAGYPDAATWRQETYIQPIMDAANTILNQPTLRRFWQDGKPVVTGTHPGNEIREFVRNKPKVYPLPGDTNTSWRLLDCDVNSPRSAWINLPGPNNRGGYNRNAAIKVWGTATELDGDVLVHLWTPCNLEGRIKIMIPGKGEFECDAPPLGAGAYVVVHKGALLTLDEYEAAIARTPFEEFLDAHPELSDIDPAEVEKIYRVVKALEN